VTDFRTSMPAPELVSTSISRSSTALGEIDRPLFAATAVMAHPGTNPTVTVPVLAGRLPDVDGLWSHLSEPAEFFGYAMPSRAVLSDVVTEFVSAVAPVGSLGAMTVTIVEHDGSAHVVVTGTAVRPTRPDPVRIDVCDAQFAPVRPHHPHWRRMAARTTSKAEVDQLRRWLAESGHVDAVGDADGVPFLGALVFECGTDLCGVDAGAPISVLDQLQQCGAIAPVARVRQCPGDAERAWWISPGYECHPVAAIGRRSHAVADAVVPPFARVS
jgi:hypothetical protein